MLPSAALLTRGAQIDRYVIAEALGEGAMGQVYKAYDRRLQRHVALKVVTPNAASSSHLASRLLQEARAAAAFDHPHAVQVFDVGMVDGELFIAMELVQGHTLRAFVGRQDIEPSMKLEWLLQIAQALAAAHDAGLVHRDIKPDNVMVRGDGVVKVLDFGIAHMMRTDDVIEDAPTVERLENDPYAMDEVVGRLTADGAVMGTPAYMAPEQILGLPIDGRADQHAWAVTAYELFVGDVPWPDGTLADVVRAVVNQPVDRVPPAHIPPGLDAVVLRAMGKLPDERFPSMRALLTACQRLSQPERRSGWTLWAPLALVAAGLTGGAGLYFGRSLLTPTSPVPSATATMTAAPTATGSSMPSAAEQAKQAEQLAYAGELGAARDAYDKCIATDAKAVACLAGRILLNQDAGRCAEMERDAEQILAHRPEDARAHRSLAEARFALGKSRASVEEALAQSHRHQPREPARPLLKALDGARLAILDGDFERALLLTKQARGDDDTPATLPLYQAAVRLEVGLLLEMGRTPAAGTLAETVLAGPHAGTLSGADDRAMLSDPTVWLMRAALVGGRRSRDVYEAGRDDWVAKWNARVGLRHRRHVWHHFYAAVTRDGEDAQDALDVFDRYGPRAVYHPGVPADAWMGRVDAWAGYYDRAVKHLDRAMVACEAIASPLEHVQAAFALGRIHEGADRRAQACSAFARVRTRWGQTRESLTARGMRGRWVAVGCEATHGSR